MSDPSKTRFERVLNDNGYHKDNAPQPIKGLDTIERYNLRMALYTRQYELSGPPHDAHEYSAHMLQEVENLLDRLDEDLY